jgi:hypothetical protein
MKFWWRKDPWLLSSSRSKCANFELEGLRPRRIWTASFDFVDFCHVNHFGMVVDKHCPSTLLYRDLSPLSDTPQRSLKAESPSSILLSPPGRPSSMVTNFLWNHWLPRPQWQTTRWHGWRNIQPPESLRCTAVYSCRS